jgi:eukaryotic-like serine/threonine-protein kinase
MLLDQESDADVVKVLDFGLVKSFLGDDEVDMTQSGILLGSPTFMAPEQARGIASPQSDIYSVGVLLFQMLAGRTPFESKNSIDVILQHLQAPVPLVRDIHPRADVPEELEAVVHRCLGKLPEARFASLDALIEALRHCIDPLTGSGWTALSPSHLSSLTPIPGGVQPRSSQIEGEAGRRARRHNWTAIIAINIAMLAVGAMVAMGLLIRTPTPPAAPLVVPAATPAPAPPVEVRAPSVPGPPMTSDAVPRRVVRFRLESSPSGAHVVLKGKDLGKTPFVLDVPEAQDGAPTTLQVSLELDGYQSQDVTAGGYGAEVVLTQRLARVGEPKAAAPVVVKGALRRPRAEPELARPGPPSPPEPVSPMIPLPQPGSSPPPATTRDELAKLASVQVEGSAARTLPEDAEPPEPFASNEPALMPESARAKAVEASVVLRFVVDVDGAVKNVQVLKGEEPFTGAAVAAARKWRFEPARLDGRPLAVYKVQRVQFRSRLPSEARGTPSFED